MNVTPNNGVNRSAQRRCRWVPVALCAPAPGYAERSASRCWTQYAQVSF
jgi:hypothetical protein